MADILKRVLLLLGAMLLLVSFLTQQFLFETWNDRLEEIDKSQEAFLMYQSNNAIFNALQVIASEDQREVVKQYQIHNYDIGLNNLRSALTDEQRNELQPKVVERYGKLRELDPETPMFQAELEVIQEEFINEEQTIADNTARSSLIFSALYIAGSFLVLVGEFISEKETKQDETRAKHNPSPVSRDIKELE